MTLSLHPHFLEGVAELPVIFHRVVGLAGDPQEPLGEFRPVHDGDLDPEPLE